MLCSIHFSLIDSNGRKAIHTELNTLFITEEALIFLNLQVFYKYIFLLQIHDI